MIDSPDVGTDDINDGRSFYNGSLGAATVRAQDPFKSDPSLEHRWTETISDS